MSQSKLSGFFFFFFFFFFGLFVVVCVCVFFFFFFFFLIECLFLFQQYDFMAHYLGVLLIYSPFETDDRVFFPQQGMQC